MKFLLISAAILGCLAAAQASSIVEAQLGAEWTNFIQVHGKVYLNAQEEQHRRGVFASNLELIKQHNEEYNQGKHTYTLDVNEYADWTHEEFKQFKASTLNLSSIDRSAPQTYSDNNINGLPSSLDWTQKGKVTPIKNQGQCSSCWAFATVATLESANAIKNGQLTSFSEQQLVDCTRGYGNQGCSGGWMDPSFKYVQQKGLTTGQSYPYHGYDQQCKQAQSAVKISSFADVALNDEHAMQSAINKYGPLAVAIDSSSQKFQFYRSGVYSDSACNKLRPTHAVTVVGYGSSGMDYWKVKNSWGTTWGNQGYVQIARNHQNECGIAGHASFPIM